MKPQIVNTRNRMLSQNIYMTLDTKKTDRNNNILIAGGSVAENHSSLPNLTFYKCLALI